ncbi:MAG: T9SS type A sorting domain-containing protein [Ignavibacteriales bacterium]|nr:T9SS type A sorting domain-containing protein [Ignavibacteriales bacterium]
MGQYCGFYPYDFRGVPENIVKKDTFIFSFIHLDYSDANATIRWPEPEYLGVRCDSMFLSGINININMFQVDSLLIPNYQDNGIYRLNIYKYGCKIIDAVDANLSLVPNEYELRQNYPNPFNPITKIEYAVPTNAKVNLKIYDVLGREVKTLVDEIQDVGYKSIEWNASNIASGVYLCHFEATSVSDPRKTFMQVKKMVRVR